MSDLWDHASTDFEAERLDRLVTQARLSCAGHFAFILGSVDRAEFEDRLALVQPRIEEKVAVVVEDDGVLDQLVRQALLDGWRNDFEASQTKTADALYDQISEGGSKVVWSENWGRYIGRIFSAGPAFQELKLDRGMFIVKSDGVDYRWMARWSGRTRKKWGMDCPTIDLFEIETTAIDGAIWGVPGAKVPGVFLANPDAQRETKLAGSRKTAGAFEEGQAAFAAGVPRNGSPFEPPSTPPGSPESRAWAENQRAWINGWDAANLAAPLPELSASRKTASAFKEGQEAFMAGVPRDGSPYGNLDDDPTQKDNGSIVKEWKRGWDQAAAHSDPGYLDTPKAVTAAVTKSAAAADDGQVHVTWSKMNFSSVSIDPEPGEEHWSCWASKDSAGNSVKIEGWVATDDYERPQWRWEAVGRRLDGHELEVDKRGMARSLDEGKRLVEETLRPLWAKDRYPKAEAPAPQMGHGPTAPQTSGQQSMFGAKQAVTTSDWGVSYNTTSGKPGVELSVKKTDDDAPNQWGGKGTVTTHPDHHGKTFDSMEDAKAYTDKHGLTASRRPRIDFETMRREAGLTEKAYLEHEELLISAGLIDAGITVSAVRRDVVSRGQYDLVTLEFNPGSKPVVQYIVNKGQGATALAALEAADKALAKRKYTDEATALARLRAVPGFREADYDDNGDGYAPDKYPLQGATASRKLAEFPPKKKDDDEDDKAPADDGSTPPPEAGATPPVDDSADPSDPAAPASPTTPPPPPPKSPSDDPQAPPHGNPKPSSVDDSDPTQMEVGGKAQMTYTMSDGTTGNVEVIFIREDKGVFYFNGPTGEFGVSNASGEWNDAEGNVFTFGSTDGSSNDDDAMKAKAPDDVDADADPTANDDAAPAAVAEDQEPPADDSKAPPSDDEDDDKKDAPPWAKKSVRH